MSFKIFSYQLFGKIKPVEKLESSRYSLKKDYVQYTDVENSDELKEFLELEKLVISDVFKNKKAEIKSLRFKGSDEESLLKEYETLKNSSQLKKYFKVKDSSDLKKYETLEKSEKVREYRELTDFMENGSFTSAKDDLARQVYKGSDEEEQEKEYKKLQKSPLIKTFLELNNSEIIRRHESTANSEKLKKFNELSDLPDKDKEKIKELKRLQSDRDIKSYFKFERSSKLSRFREALDSYDLKRFRELKSVVESDDFRQRVKFLKDKKKFEKSEAYKKFKRLKDLSASDDLKFFLKYRKSSLLKNYYDTEDADILKRFFELKDLTSTEDFIKRKTWLDDPKKWEKSVEYGQEQKYHEMKKRPHLIKYFEYKGTDKFDFFKDWEISFEDEFNKEDINHDKWSPLSLWAGKMTGRNFAMPGDLHLCTNGENIKGGGKLTVETRKEKVEGLVWNAAVGFIPSEFNYTSGLASTGKSFWQKDGIYEAKIKFQPVKEVVSSFILQGEHNSPRIHLLEMGLKNRIGISHSGSKGKLVMEGLDISNLKKGKWYIFTLHKEGSSLIWKINDTEVLKLEKPELDFMYHINLFSIVVDDIPRSLLPVRFQVDWVRCYRKK